jgi:hypothetical protein
MSIANAMVTATNTPINFMAVRKGRFRSSIPAIICLPRGEVMASSSECGKENHC